CQEEMQNKSKWIWDGWDMEYASWHEEYYCKTCKIRYRYRKWEIPKKIERPTEKQVKTILFINNKCGLDLEYITKKQFSF
ncbi:hypothetical protein, partial [Acinetobacter baumannii]|uniref:hypothetical protein n=1 Tax=Acinetobacter baumannii TaxID=470 RepID=UPI001BB46C0F